MRQPSITIIGAGFGGLGTAVELKRAGYHRRHRAREGRRGRAACGARTPTPTPRATCPRRCTRGRSRPTPTGRTATPGRTRSSPTSSARPREQGCSTSSAPGVEVYVRGVRRRKPPPGTWTTTTGEIDRQRRRRRRPWGSSPGRSVPDLPGAALLRGAGLPLRRVGPLGRPARQARSPCSAPARAPSSSCRASSRRRATSRCSSGPRRTSRPSPTASTPHPQPDVPPLPPHPGVRPRT